MVSQTLLDMHVWGDKRLGVFCQKLGKMRSHFVLSNGSLVDDDQLIRPRSSGASSECVANGNLAFYNARCSRSRKWGSGRPYKRRNTLVPLSGIDTKVDLCMVLVRLVHSSDESGSPRTWRGQLVASRQESRGLLSRVKRPLESRGFLSQEVTVKSLDLRILSLNLESYWGCVTQSWSQGCDVLHNFN